MFENIFWISVIVVLLGFLFFIFFMKYEKDKNITSGGKRLKLFRISFQYYILIFILVLGIAVSGFIYFNNRELFEYDKISEEPNPIKEVQYYIDNDEYDRCIAYAQLIGYNTIFDYDLITEEDEILLSKSPNIFDRRPVYNIAFVQKDNKDYIKITNVSRPRDNYLFKSNLPYSFDLLLSLFEDAADIELSDEFLNGRDTGIFFTIAKVLITRHHYAFVSEINGHKYYAYYDEELIILK